MRLTDDDLGAIWRGSSGERDPDRSSCLTDTEWARLLSGEVEPGERVRAASHIASCAACTEEYRLLQPLQSWAGEVGRVLSPAEAGRSERSSGWRAWWSSPRLALAMTAAVVLLITQGVTLSRLLDTRNRNAQLETRMAERESALEATQTSLAAAQEQLRTETAAQAQLNDREQQRQAQLDTLQQRLAELSTPRLDVPIAALEPGFAGAVRGSSDPQIVTASPDAPAVTLILQLSPLPARSTLLVEIVDQSGQVRWTGRTERQQGTDALTLSLPREGYPPGEYVIRLFDVTTGRRSLASYPVVIRHVPEGSR